MEETRIGFRNIYFRTHWPRSLVQNPVPADNLKKYNTKHNPKINILENLRYRLNQDAKSEVVIFRFYYKIIVRLITINITAILYTVGMTYLQRNEEKNLTNRSAALYNEKTRL